ncbi:MAG: trypsin-like peptidase domain-containing protein [Acidobacteriota bacterium]|nr:trypsin-like peptidase domain-containing protein [Acidobacteriota bacterium]
MKKFLCILAVLLFAVSAWSQDVYEAETENFEGVDIANLKKAESRTYDWLVSERVAGTEDLAMIIPLTDTEQARLNLSDCKDCRDLDERQTRLIGVHQPIDARIDFENLAARSRAMAKKPATLSSGMAKRTMDNGYVWTTALQAEGANGLRIHFTDFNLPQGALLFLYNNDGQVHGPYMGQGPNGTGDFWSHTVFGEWAWVQVRLTQEVTTDAVNSLRFNIAAISHLGHNFKLPEKVGHEAHGKADCSRNEDCVENAQCYSSESAIQYARNAAAKMIFEENGGSYICSGGLMNDNDSSDRLPWFLTANHCISTQTVASTLETLFKYRSNCGSCSASYSDSVLGSTLWATGSSGDFTLLELSNLPSGGWGLNGWTTAATYDNDGDILYRVSHPKGSPQSYSTHTVDSGWSSSTAWIFSELNVGTTEGGSSGSPLLNANQKVVGQLRGASYTNENYDLCVNQYFRFKDGAFSHYWNSVKAYLGSGSGTYKMHVDDIDPGYQTINMGFLKLYQPKIKVTVLDTEGNVVPNARVTGSVAALGATGWATTGSDGVATFLLGPMPSKVNYTLCVTNITHDHFNTYDSSADVETCDSW